MAGGTVELALNCCCGYYVLQQVVAGGLVLMLTLGCNTVRDVNCYGNGCEHGAAVVGTCHQL